MILLVLYLPVDYHIPIPLPRSWDMEFRKFHRHEEISDSATEAVEYGEVEYLAQFLPTLKSDRSPKGCMHRIHLCKVAWLLTKKNIFCFHNYIKIGSCSTLQMIIRAQIIRLEDSIMKLEKYYRTKTAGLEGATE